MTENLVFYTIPVTELQINPSVAKIIRTGRISLQQGNQSLVFDELPKDLVVDSVNIRITGDVIIQEYSVEEASHISLDLVENIKEIQEKVKILNDNLALLEVSKKTLENNFNMAEKIKESFRNLRDTPEKLIIPNSNRIITIFDQLYSILEEVKVSKSEVATEFDTTKEKLAGLEKKLVKIRNEIEKNRKKCIQAMLVANAGEYDVRIEYENANIDFRLFYDMYITSNQSTLENSNNNSEYWADLAILASIINRTNEDFTNVTISLDSMAIPKTLVPPRTLLYIDSIADLPGETTTAETFRLPGKLSLPRTKFPMIFHVRNIPVENTHVLFSLDLTRIPGTFGNSLENSWQIPGSIYVAEVLMFECPQYIFPWEINVFLDGLFMTTVQHPELTSPGTEIGVPVRISDFIKATKTAIGRKVGKMGYIRSKERSISKYKIHASNTTPRSIQLVIHDRVPQDNNWITDLEVISDRPYRVYKNHIVRFDVTLAGNSEIVIPFDIDLKRRNR